MRNGILYQRGGYETREQALIAEAEVRKQKTNTDFIKLCESRLEEIEINRSQKHFKENLKLIKNLISIWTGEITRQTIETYLNQIAQKSHQTANKRLRLIKALFNHGIERGYLYLNPAKGIKPFSASPKKRYVPIWEDVEKVIKLSGDFKPYLLTIKNTLGRAGEINQLLWEDVDLQQRTITLTTRKARNSDLTSRKVYINDELLAVLGEPKTELVFPHPENVAKIYWHRLDTLYRLCDEAKVKRFSFHALRHYGASKLAEAGIPITDIQRILGHQRTTTTDIYLRSLTPSLKEAMEHLSRN